MPKLKTNFDKLLSLLGEFNQDRKLTYPSIDAYKKQLGLVYNNLIKDTKGIVIYSDYDADGICSGVILSSFLRNALIAIHGEAYAEDKIKLVFSDRQKSFGLKKEEFYDLIKTNDMVITVDNGSDIDFHNPLLEAKLLVLDHHPSANTMPYILNPNTGNAVGEYSTSGGRVTYDFISHLDILLKKTISTYNAIDNSLQMETLKELAALTLISDMAKLCSENRSFVREAWESIRFKKDKKNNIPHLPIYSYFKNVTQKEASFNIINIINAVGRLEMLNEEIVKGKTYIEAWIRPDSIAEWKKADKFLMDVNKVKKEKVNNFFNKITIDKSSAVNLIFAKEAPIGLTGLIANNISSAHNNKPTIIGAINDAGDIVFSGRGENVKKILMMLVDGNGGGHNDASGGTIKTEDTPPEEIMNRLADKLNNYIQKNKAELNKDRPIEVVNDAKKPLNPSELSILVNSFQEHCGGVEYYKPIKVLLSDFNLLSHHVFAKSGWAVAKLGDVTDGNEFKVLFNTKKFPIYDIQKANSIVISLNTDGEIDIEKLILEKKDISNLIIMKEVSENSLIINGENKPSVKATVKREEKLSISFVTEHGLLPDKENDNIYFYRDDTDINEIIKKRKDLSIIVEGSLEESQAEGNAGLIIVPVYKDETTPLEGNSQEQNAVIKIFQKIVNLKESNGIILLPKDPLGKNSGLLEDSSVIKKTIEALMQNNITSHYTSPSSSTNSLVDNPAAVENTQ